MCLSPAEATSFPPIFFQVLACLLRVCVWCLTEKLMPIPWDEEKIEASLIATKILSPKQERQQPPQRSQQPPRQQQQKQEF